MTETWINSQQGELISIQDRGLAYGDGFFATMRVNPLGEILFLESHLARLSQAAFRLKMKHASGWWQPSNQLVTHLKSLAQSNPNRGLKLIITRGVSGRGYQPASDFTACEIISVFSIPAHYQHWQCSGIKLANSTVALASQPLLAGIKHLNRLEQVLIKSFPLPQGFDDWLVYDYQQRLIESSMANIFLFIDGKWLTPKISHAGVAGVMRENTIYGLAELGFDVAVTDVYQDQIMNASHAVISNSLFGLVDVLQLEQQKITPWPLTKKLTNILGVSL
ncbi:MAG: aminodeoxychorismate lyase [Parashewanella sp.]